MSVCRPRKLGTGLRGIERVRVDRRELSLGVDDCSPRGFSTCCNVWFSCDVS